ncbi:MAG: hotdog fold thioesterase [Candidatus Endonucleobacter bathymodioli]|uniref:Hotdog fold thioesterase n=1 Tax=Candidatus Endonucleibacter bathymodioli TaxID=539814 RepID=A0AA90NRM4_9GAMM|nr:hotdog fold thioesterase [Candidatus Endonucleobacter bathymodioli]
MGIWKKHADIDTANVSMSRMCEHLGMVITNIGEDFIECTMPVDRRTQQPMGILHGGASLALAETLGSVAANLACDSTQYCLGLEINANHLRPVSTGHVTGIARPIHIGKNTQVWDINIKDNQNQVTCVSRMTLAVKMIS